MPHNLTEDQLLTDDLERQILADHDCRRIAKPKRQLRFNPLRWLQVQALRLFSGLGWSDSIEWMRAR